jgi:hypothetical protein
VSHNHPDITLFEKTNKLLHLIGVCIPNSGNLPTPYTEEMRKCAEFSNEVKQHWQVEVVCILPVIAHDAEVILHSA